MGQEASTHLQGTARLWARLLWVLLSLGVLVGYFVAIPSLLQRTDLATGALWVLLMPWGYIVVSAIIALRRSDDWMALLTSFALLAMGVNLLAGANEILGELPGWQWFDLVLVALSTLSFLLTIFLFPNGRFVPGWTRWVFGVAAGLTIVLSSASLLFGTALAFAYVVPFLGTALVGLVFQVFRYRTASNRVQRQQAKWVLVGLLAPVVVAIIYFVTISIDSHLLQGSNWYVDGLLFVIISLAWVLPVTLMFSMLRYRLWDLDLILRRTVVYSLVTAALIVIYLVTVVVLQQIFSVLTGVSQNELVTVLSTLAIAALFIPIRNRVQLIIDRRFNRRKYDAQKVLQTFAATVRDETDLPNLTASLIQVVDETMQPKSTSVWLRKEKPHV